MAKVLDSELSLVEKALIKELDDHIEYFKLVKKSLPPEIALTKKQYALLKKVIERADKHRYEIYANNNCPRGVISVGNIIYYIADDGFYAYHAWQSIPIGNNKVDETFIDDLDDSYLLRSIDGKRIEYRGVPVYPLMPKRSNYRRRDIRFIKALKLRK